MKNVWIKKMEKTRKSSLEIMIENQKLWNKSYIEKTFPSNWKKASLKAVEIIHDCIGFKLVSVQLSSEGRRAYGLLEVDGLC